MRPRMHSKLSASLALSLLGVALYAFLMFLLPSPAWPEVVPYGGPMLFDGLAASADLQVLAGEFPSRVAGSAAYDGAATWIAQRFGQLGLTAVVEQFSCPELPSDDSSSKPYAAWVTTSNVTAVFPGTSSEAVIVFAHLDSVWSPGADDNASGVAAVLELARVVSSEQHPFTYAFVVFGGEEEGRWGSRAWVGQHIHEIGRRPALLMNGVNCGFVRLAVGLDSVGYDAGTLPQVCSLSTGRRKSSLGSLAALLAVLGDERPAWLADCPSFKTQALGGPGLMGSDHVSFINAGVSAACFARMTEEGVLSPYLNTQDDTLDHVSSDTLGDAGQLVERLLRTVEGIEPASWSTDGDFLLSPRGFTPGWAVTCAAFVLILLLGTYSAPALVARLTRRSVRIAPPTARRAEITLGAAEARWYMFVVGWALVLALALALAYLPGMPFGAVWVPWLALTLGSPLVLTWLRNRWFWPDSSRTNDYLCLVLAIWGAWGLLVLGPAALIYYFWPVIVLSRLRGRPRELAVLFRLVLVAWVCGWALGILREMAWVSLITDYAIHQLYMRWWFLGIGYLVFPAIWQATAKEHRAIGVLVQRKAAATQVTAALSKAPGLGHVTRIYSGPDETAQEAARALEEALSPSAGRLVLQNLREIGDASEVPPERLGELLTAPANASFGGETAAEALERVQSAMAEVVADLERWVAASGETTAKADRLGLPLIVLPEGLATLQGVAAAVPEPLRGGKPHAVGLRGPGRADRASTSVVQRSASLAGSRPVPIVAVDLATGLGLREL